MNTCKYEQQVARWFDGEIGSGESIEDHIDQCPTCQEYVSFLKTTREQTTALAGKPTIADAQMPTFLDGLRDQVDAVPVRRFNGIWAMASLACAAIISAVSIWYVVVPQQQPVEAHTLVESHSTAIEGATTEVEYSDDGTTTVWINVPDGEMM